MYKLTNTSVIVRTADGAYIPAVLTNKDYQDYLAWVAAGNTPDPVDPPTPVELAAAAQAAQDAQDIADAKAYAKLAALKAMTPAQIQTWVNANVTNLVQAQDAIKTLAIAVSVLLRRL